MHHPTKYDVTRPMGILETNRYVNPHMRGFNAGREARKLEAAERDRAIVNRLADGYHAD